MIKSVEAWTTPTVKIVTSYPCGSFLSGWPTRWRPWSAPPPWPSGRTEVRAQSLRHRPVQAGALGSERKAGVRALRPGDFEGAPKLKSLTSASSRRTPPAACCWRSGQLDVAFRLPVTEVAALAQQAARHHHHADDHDHVRGPEQPQGPAEGPQGAPGAQPGRRTRPAIVNDVVDGMAPWPIRSSPRGLGLLQHRRLPVRPGRGQKLLAAAGYPNGFEFTLWTPWAAT